jgi:hypothetical protein
VGLRVSVVAASAGPVGVGEFVDGALDAGTHAVAAPPALVLLVSAVALLLLVEVLRQEIDGSSGDSARAAGLVAARVALSLFSVASPGRGRPWR